MGCRASGTAAAGGGCGERAGIAPGEKHRWRGGLAAVAAKKEFIYNTRIAGIINPVTFSEIRMGIHCTVNHPQPEMVQCTYICIYIYIVCGWSSALAGNNSVSSSSQR